MKGAYVFALDLFEDLRAVLLLLDYIFFFMAVLNSGPAFRVAYLSDRCCCWLEPALFCTRELWSELLPMVWGRLFCRLGMWLWLW